jgi:hypothetical protein
MRWYWSYAIHVLLWAVLSYLALHFKVVGHTSVVALLLVPALPYLLLSALGATEYVGGVVSILFNIAVLVGWPAAGLIQWRERPGLLLAYPHLLIALAGLWCAMVVGSINFPFRL